MALNPGDIGFVQYNADGTDNFAFVTLVDILGGEVILFTDNGWFGNNSGFRTGEGIITWTAPVGGVPAGTVITIDTTPSASLGSVTESGSLDFSGSGDQIIAYQGTTPIAALNNESNSFQSDATNSNTSALPQGLVDGQSAVALTEIDNAVYTGVTSGDPDTIRAALNDPTHWIGSDSSNQTFSGTFTLTGLAIGEMQITEYMYSGNDGEFIEFTNVGTAAVDMTGWSFDDDSALSGTVDLSAFGIVQPGESVILTEADAATFRAAWGLSDTVKVIGNLTANLGRNDAIYLFDADGVLVDRLTYGDQNIPDTIRTQNVSGWASVDHLADQTIDADWQLSSVNDEQNSRLSSGSDIGNPGLYNTGAAGIVVIQSGGTTSVAEGGVPDTYTIALRSQPTADVTLTVTPDAQTNLGAGAGNAVTLTFTPSDWNVAQVVTVTAIDDGAIEGNHSSSITHTVSSGDSHYDGISLPTITANLTDNDFSSAPPTLEESSLTPLLDLASTGSGFVSGVVGDITDPASTLGIDFTLADIDTLPENLTVTVTSSNQAVVADANLVLTGSGTTRNLTITPASVGFADITVTVSDGSSVDTYTINYAASAPGNIGSRFYTGTSDASTAIALDATYMLVADDEDQTLRLYDRTQSGLPIASFDLNSALGLNPGDEVDIEASTRIGNRIYWIGSHSNTKDGDESNPRELIFSTDLSGSGAASTLTVVGQYHSLESDLVAWDSSNAHGLGAGYFGLATSSANGTVPEAPNGFSIEGLTIAPDGLTAYVSFRAPLTDTTTRTNALIVPMTNFGAIVDGSATGGSALFGAPIQLDLGGRGIRSIERNGTGEYLIIAGPAGSGNDFALYTWTGNPSDAPVERDADLTALNTLGSFEGVVEVPDNLSSATELQLLVDNGDTDWYGNGTDSKDLTQDNFQKFRTETIPLGNPVTPETPAIFINEVDADTPGTDTAEFVELYDGGDGNTPLDGLVLVFFNGSNDLSYTAFDLDGYSTNAEGFFVLGNAGVANVDWVFPDNSLQNGADAVALYQGNAADFPTNTLVTTINLLDAIAYDTSDADDPGLLNGLGLTTQFDENAIGNGASESNSRVPNGTGTFVTQSPTPGASNVPTFNLQITEIWSGQSGTDLTADWFEITNTGNAPWVAGVDPNLFYDDDSADPTVADPIQGITQIDPGESVIVVIDTAASVAPFTTVWGDVIHLTNVEVGYTDGAGLGDGGDAVTLFVGGPAANTIADIAAYPNTAAFDGASYDVELGTFSIAGQNGAVATNVLGGNSSNVPAVGSPGNGDPIVPITLTLIHDIQGNASTQLPNISGSGAHDDRSPLEGQSVTIQGVVTAVFPELGGFFMQEELLDADADATTSEGIFVFTGGIPTVSEGYLVTVTGAVDEYFGMTQIDNDNGDFSVTIEDAGNNLGLVSTALIDLPATGDINDFYESYEGMLVQFSNTLYVSEYFEVARYGQIVLTEDSRPYQYTHIDHTPTAAEYEAYQADLARRQIILDDGNNTQNAPLPDGTFFYPQPNGLGTGTQGTDFFRGGDSISHLTGVLHWSWAGFSGTDAWRIRPTVSNPITFTVENPRPTEPVDVGGNITIASLNVLNYFTTLDQGGNQTGPSDNLDPRGASSTDELDRQTDKLVAALKELDADVIALAEVENNNDVALNAIVDALNAELGAGTYAAINTGYVGTDAITVALIYRTAVVAPQGSVALLDDPAFTDPNNTGEQRNRPAIAQSFTVIDPTNPDLGESFSVIANHLKSKGSGTGAVADNDQLDGQGFSNDTRTDAANYLVNTWIPQLVSQGFDEDVLIVGDLNAYRGEDPITAIRNAGYTDLIESFGGDDAYSYVFDGQLGYLDHALANASLTAQVTGVTEWHINADEVNVFDYNNTVRDGNEASFEAKPTGNPLFEPNAVRTSDHDPIVIGLDLFSAPAAPRVNGKSATIYVNAADTIVGNAIGSGTTYAGLLFSATDADFGLGVSPDDVIAGTEGDDNIWGGTEGSDTIDAGGGNDTVGFGNGDAWVDAGAGDDFVYAAGDGAGNSTIDLGEGDDQFWAATGNNTLISASGNNTIGIGSGHDSVTTGAGDDFIYTVNGGGGDDNLNLGDGNNKVWVETGNYTITTGNGNDSLGLGTGTDTVNAGDGNNIIYMIDAATAGNKDIVTGMGDDYIATGAGDDWIDAGTGFNTLWGGAGADTFTVRSGAYNYLGGFELGSDRMQLIDLDFGDLSFIQGTGADVLDAFITLGETVLVQIENTSVTTLNNTANFI